jgi:hypothetical protein
MSELMAAEGSVLFHGTRASAVASIMERGLQPRQPGEQERGFELGDLLGFTERRGVYMTTILPLAREAGRGSADAVVRTVNVAGLPTFEQRLWMPGAPSGWPVDESGAIVVYGCPVVVEPRRPACGASRPRDASGPAA